ncbi:MAG: PilZ domain-containing protein [Deltaproteobacteria bacterium]
MATDSLTQKEQYKREYDRKEVLVETRILDGKEWHDCRIINISVGGVKLRISGNFSQGGEVLVNIGHFGEFSGSIAWQNSEELGVRFTHNPAEIAEVVMGLAMYG